jgi:uncharacterized membrane protein YhaH (DUF805 family)
MINLPKAVRLATTNTFNYHSRASRAEYWWFTLYGILAHTLLILTFPDRSATIGSVLTLLLALHLTISGLSLSVRRLHDTDRSGWWLLIGFIPFIGSIILIVLLALPSTPGNAKHT